MDEKSNRAGRATRRWLPGLLAGAVFATLLAPASPARAADVFKYLALGDSFASGTGAGDYADNNADGCFRSKVNYAQLIRSTANRWYPTTVDVAACSGAKIEDVLRNQLQKVDKTVDAVTISVGGNDLSFSKKIEGCVFGDCSQTPLATPVELQILTDRLLVLYDRLLQAMSGTAKLVVVNYPYLFPEEAEVTFDRCPAIWATFNPGEIGNIRRAWSDVNYTMRDVASRFSRIQFVDMHDTFQDHQLCDKVPYANGYVRSPLAASFHPNDLGHQVQAEVLRQRRVPF